MDMPREPGTPLSGTMELGRTGEPACQPEEGPDTSWLGSTVPDRQELEPLRASGLG